MIIDKNTDMVRRIPGIGKKLAERLILELKDKFDEEEMADFISAGGIPGDDKIMEVRQALKTLGYNGMEINRALLKMKPEYLKASKVEEILRAALKEV